MQKIIKKKPFLLKSVRLIDPFNSKDQISDVIIKDGKINYLKKEAEINFFKLQDYEFFNCKGKILSPGIFDLRVYLNDTSYENISTLKKAAFNSGIIKVGVSPFQNPLLDNPIMIEHLLEKENNSHYQFLYPFGSATKKLNGKEISELGLMDKAGAVGFTDSPNCIQDSLVMRRVMSYASMLNKPILQNPQDKSLAGLTETSSTTIAGEMNEGEVSTRLGLVGIPSCAEVIIVERDIRLAKLTGAKYHVSNVSTKETIEAIKRAKVEGLQVTCDTSPQYFCLNELELSSYNTSFKLSPPLREESDRLSVLKAISEDIIDIITSDHRSMSKDTKILPFSSASIGASGIETLLPLALTLKNEINLSIYEILKKMTVNPSKLINLEYPKIDVGEKATFIVFDPNFNHLLNQNDMLTSPTPFNGRPVEGMNCLTFVDGVLFFNNFF